MFDIYTDGSGIDGKIGAAFVVYYYGTGIHQECYRMNSYNSAFQVECCALEKALSYVQSEIPCSSILNIYSDCLSLLQVLSRPISTNYTIFNIKKLYGDISSNATIRLHWIKAHAGFMGNERADVLAKKAALSDSVDYIEIPGSKRIANRVILEDCLKEWKTRWSESEKNKEHLRFIQIKRHMTLYNNIDVNQFLTGHGRFPSYLKKSCLQETDLCPRCEVPADSDHFFYRCEIFKDLRDLHGITDGHVLDVRKHVKYVEAVLGYINVNRIECGILI
ncbi:uncharacterized protein LOC118192916 [Stegodyphus dumicola]|uniref:uncharacterized protein LOC118192916 n=1 Tax=Stegodyphus dumicola TaxID=202533 RepID=UPI0015AFAE2F|nr:uncharacterized protein LOC118192916 [Stegodyphus dumicola]